MSVYPSHFDVDVVLRDGSTVRVRPIRPEDREPLEAFLKGLTEESSVFRFFSPVREFGWVLDRFLDVDFRSRHSLIALTGAPDRIVGHGFYAEVRPGRAEVALEVAEDFQGRGLGTTLIEHLAQAAAANEIAVFEAEVMPANHKMLGVFRSSGFAVRTRSMSGTIGIEFPTSLTEEARVRFAEREHFAANAALKLFFEPRAIAVVGASRQPKSIGGEVFRNLLGSGFAGPVYPVSPHPVVQSVVAYPTVEAVPGPVDLAVVVVPAAAVVTAAEQCARKGVRALVVISAGFAETGESGRVRQAELLEVCRRSGMRLIGPNCLGILNTDLAHRMNATFAPAFPPQGRIGFMSQSGALGLAVIDRAGSLALGISTFISVGNKADISGNDLLEYWEDDKATDLVLLYLESFGNPRRFARISRRMSRTKPILAVKSGRTAAGVQATSSHTGALLSASDATVDALFEQSGVIRCETLGEMFDIASLLASQPPPAGGRVAIVTNAGGLGILCADACVALGLEVPELAENTLRALQAFLPAEASVGNPIDMIASASGEDYEQALRVLAAAEEVDALIAIFIPPLVTPADEVAAGIRRALPSLAGQKPLLAVFTSAAGPPASLSEGESRVPTYSFPEEAARALARVAGWSRRLRAPLEAPYQAAGARPDEAHAIVAQALGEQPGGGWLNPAQVARLLDCYGIPTIRSEVVITPEEAGAAAERIGGAVALKGIAPGLVHKSEAGAVVLGLEGGAAARAATLAMAARLTALGHSPAGFELQAMVPRGVEMIVGVVQDPVFGAVVACGAGGTAVELLRDVSFRIAPLSVGDAEAMLTSLRTYPLLTGYRGAAPTDVAALREVLLRVGALADDQHAVVELDLNPVMVTPAGVVVVDARIRLEATQPRPPEGSRRRPEPATKGMT